MADAAYVLVPIPITDANLTSTTVAESDHGVWDNTSTYGIADSDRCISHVTHRIYQSARAGNLNHDPTDPVNLADPSPWWVDIGSTNQRAMFDDQATTQTVAASPLTVVIAPGSFNGLDLRYLDADQLAVTVKDAPGGAVIFTDTSDLEDSDPPDYFEHFYSPYKLKTDYIATGIDAYRDMEVTITLTAVSGTVKCGMVSIGDLRSIGIALKGAKVKPKTYSSFKDDGFGGTKITRRRSARDLSFTTLVDLNDANDVIDTMEAVQDIPCIWIVSTLGRLSGYRALGIGSGELSADHDEHAILNATVQGFK